MSKPSPLTILVDLDGVSCAFVEAACRAHGREFDPESWPPGEYDVARVSGMTAERFWRGINRRGAEFWRNLEAYPWFEPLYSELSRLGKVCFVTAPNGSPQSAAGKLLWLQDRFGERFQDYILTREKHLLSRSGAILIDDSDDNVVAFNQGGGRGILFPQVWNSGHRLAGGDRVEYVLDQVFTHLAEMTHAI